MSDPDAEVLIRGEPRRPRASVVVPVYNAAGSLRTAVTSALEQTMSDLEVIIVDDGSTDDSVKNAVALAKCDSRITVLRHRQNLGPAAARNTAIDTATGKWIAVLDADDEMAGHRLHALCTLGEERSADFVADTVPFGDQDGGIEPGQEPACGEVRLLTLEDMIRSDIPLNGMRSFGYLKPIMRRSFLSRWQLRYDPRLRFAEDFNIYARALIHGARFVLCSNAFYVYRQTPVSASRAIRILPPTAHHALQSSRELRARAGRLDALGLRTLLVEHEKKWEVVVWFNQVKRALRERNARDVVRLGLRVPCGPRALIRFARDRRRYEPQIDPRGSAPGGPGAPLRVPGKPRR